ncbi:hypothetical protein MBLNU457_6522t1 [Dothideomycetes sp. NU457]
MSSSASSSSRNAAANSAAPPSDSEGQPATEAINEYLLVDLIPRPTPAEMPIWRSLDDTSDSEEDWDHLDDYSEGEDGCTDDIENGGHAGTKGRASSIVKTQNQFEDEEGLAPETIQTTSFDKERFLNDYISQTAAEAFRNRLHPFPLRLFRKISRGGRFGPADPGVSSAANARVWSPEDVLRFMLDWLTLREDFQEKRFYLAEAEEGDEDQGEESRRGRPSS